MALKSASTLPTVVIGFAEAFAAVEAAWSLARSGYRVVAFSRETANPALRFSRCVEVVRVTPPEVDAMKCIADVRSLIDSTGAVAYLPLDDASLWATAQVESACVRVAPDARGSAVGLNKEMQIAAARQFGLRVPDTTTVELDSIEFLGSPIIVKPANAVRLDGQRLTRPMGAFCATEGELDAARTRLAPGRMLVQPVIDGVGVGVFGTRGNSGFAPWSAHRRVRMVNPAGSASSACESIPVDDSIREPIAAMLDHLDWRGLFMVEFLVDHDGVPWFMELNGRAWGSLALARRRGLEYPAWAVQDSLGAMPDPPYPADMPHIRARHLGREITHLAFVARGPQSDAIRSWPRLSVTLRNMLTIRSYDRLYNFCVRDPLVIFADTARTIIDQVHGFVARGR